MPRKTVRLLSEERRRAILEILDKDGRVTVEDLSDRFSVSAVTVRNDLEALSSQGLLVRSHGGAMPPREDAVRDYPLNLKSRMNTAEKTRIAQAAADLVQPWQTVFLDSGSTSMLLATELSKRKLEGLTVITHSLPVAMTLAETPSVSVIMIGGLLRHISCSNVGPQAERMLHDLHADHLFLAADAIDLHVGMSTPDILEAQLNSLMIKISQETTLIADATKFGRRGMSLIGGLSQLRRIVSDKRLPHSAVEQLRAMGIEVILC